MSTALIVKICGLKTGEALDAALQAGADMVGFVFFPKSPRHLAVDTAGALGRQVRGRAAKVALVVDAGDAAIEAIIEALAPDLLQLHGAETPARVAEIRRRFGRPVMKAVGIASRDDVAALAHHAPSADRILIDAKAPRGAAHPGGNGIAFDWSLIRALDLAKPFMLSGGLTPDNVGQALHLTRAPGVDVSSGVESAPGVKDVARIEAFVAAARAAVAP